MRWMTLTEAELVDLVLAYRDTSIQPVGTEEGARAFIAQELSRRLPLHVDLDAEIKALEENLARLRAEKQKRN